MYVHCNWVCLTYNSPVQGAPARTSQFTAAGAEQQEGEDATSKENATGRGGRGRGRGRGRGLASAKKGRANGGAKNNKPAGPVTPPKKTKEANPESEAKATPKRGRPRSTTDNVTPAKKPKVEQPQPPKPAGKPHKKAAGKAKPSPKKAAAPKPTATKPEAKAKGKAKAKACKDECAADQGVRSTFAGRPKPTGEQATNQWAAIRDAFNDHVRATIPFPSKQEDTCCVSDSISVFAMFCLSVLAFVLAGSFLGHGQAEVCIEAEADIRGLLCHCPGLCRQVSCESKQRPCLKRHVYLHLQADACLCRGSSDFKLHLLQKAGVLRGTTTQLIS